MNSREVDRRSALQLVGGAVAAAALVSPGIGLAVGRAGLGLLDSGLGESERRLARQAFGDARPLELEPDLVVQWRGGLAEQVIAAGSAIAFVRWDKAFVLAGLAREHGLRTSQRRIARAMFRIEIG